MSLHLFISHPDILTLSRANMHTCMHTHTPKAVSGMYDRTVLALKETCLSCLSKTKSQFSFHSHMSVCVCTVYMRINVYQYTAYEDGRTRTPLLNCEPCRCAACVFVHTKLCVYANVQLCVDPVMPLQQTNKPLQV